MSSSGDGRALALAIAGALVLAGGLPTAIAAPALESSGDSLGLYDPARYT